MNIEKPYKSRAIIEETMSGIMITIPAKRNYFIMAFMIIWLTGWLFGGGTAISALFTNDEGGFQGFLAIWLCAWAFGLVAVCSTLLWFIIGKEVVTIDRGILTIKKVGAIFARTKSYSLADAANFRTVATNTDGIWGRRNNIAYNEPGAIVFDYGMKSKNFGMGIDEPEAIYLVNFLKEKELIPNK